MLRVLLNLPEAQEFLIEDRRGRIAAQISEALQKELHHAEDADGFEKAQTAVSFLLIFQISNKTYAEYS